MKKPLNELFQQARDQISRDDALTARLLHGTCLTKPSLPLLLAHRGFLLLLALSVLAGAVAFLGAVGTFVTGESILFQPGKSSAGFSGLTSMSDPAWLGDVSGEATASPVFETNAFSFSGMALRAVIPLVFWMIPVLWLYLMAILDLPEEFRTLTKEQHA